MLCISPPPGLHGGEGMNRIPGGRVEVFVEGVELVVELAVVWVGLDGFGYRGPIGVGVYDTGPDAGQKRVPVGGADGLLGELLTLVDYVRDDLGPQPTLGTAAHRHQSPGFSTRLAHSLQKVPDPEGASLEHGPVEVAAGVAHGQAADNAAGVRIAYGVALPGKVGQDEQALRAGRYPCCFLRELGEREVVRQLLDPFRERPRRGHAAGQNVGAGEGTGGGPEGRRRGGGAPELESGRRRTLN